MRREEHVAAFFGDPDQLDIVATRIAREQADAPGSPGAAFEAISTPFIDLTMRVVSFEKANLPLRRSLPGTILRRLRPAARAPNEC